MRWILALPLVAALLLAACGKAPPAEAPVRAVKLVTVAESRPVARHEYAGQVQARVQARLGFRVAGKVVERQVEPGQRVRAGQVLARLDARDYRLAADAARAQVTAAQTQRDLAAAELRRFQALRDKGFISSAEMDRRSAGLKAAESGLQQARAQLAAQSNQAAYAQLAADADGVVTAVEAEPGQVVAAGQPVVWLARDGARDVVFAVPEDRVAALAVGQPVAVRLWAGDARWQGEIREVAASADPVTRTFAVKAALQGPRADAVPLGATATVTAEAANGVAGGAAGAAAEDAVIRLPTSALRQEGGQTAVWLLDEASMTVRAQPVQVSGVAGHEVLIASGLTPGMRVVASGVHVLEAGQKVRVYEPKTASGQEGQALKAINNVANSAALPAPAPLPASAPASASAPAAN
ncbi:efflux RND transporter periplasmic adaptor subunit [Comamonadaceae bacterium OH2545_COT-014]|nr:efflux RND transporter periplasmic adaptor subunit [Comamonadaceae bacterium OH2545_COT-014]